MEVNTLFEESKKIAYSNKATLIKGFFVYSIMVGLLNGIIQNIFGKSLLFTLVSLILTSFLGIGIIKYIDEVIEGNKPDLKTLFSYKDKFIEIALLMGIITVFVTLWSLLLIIPGIIAALNYSLAPYIMMKNKDIDPLEAIKESKERMKGYRLKLVVIGLLLSLLALLIPLTLGIYLIWFIPLSITIEVLFARKITKA